MINRAIRNPRHPGRQTPPPVSYALLVFCVAVLLAIAGMIKGLVLPAFTRYLIELALFTILIGIFVLDRRRQGQLNIFDYPVSLTALAFIQLGLAPVFVFLQPDDMGAFVTEDGLVAALLLCIVGMAAFWCGTMMFRGHGTERPALTEVFGDERQTLVGIGIALFAVGCVAKTYLLVNHMYSFVGSMDAVSENLASVQLLKFLSQFAAFGLAVVAIEKYSSRAADFIAFVFWPMFLIQCGWGLISGMKSELISNFVIVAAVATLSRRKLALSWVLTPVLALVILYPAYNSYRYLVRGSGHNVTDFSSAAETGTRALQQNEEIRGGSQGWMASGFQSSIDRLNGLTSVAQIMALGPYKAVLQGNEKMWMLPIYPFVPRFLWKDKPILDKGARFSVLLGGTEDTSIAVTYPGDCYLLGGWLGVLGGMFVWGMLAEGLVQFLYRNFSKKALFAYICLTATAVSSPIENTAFAFWSGFVKQAVAVAFIAFIVYGYTRHRSPFVRRSAWPPTVPTSSQLTCTTAKD